MSLIRKHVAVLQAWACLALVNYDYCYKIKRKHLKLKGLKYCKKVFKNCA